MRQVKRTRQSLAIFLSLLFACVPVSAQAQVSEYDLKIAFIYNFISFTDWPVEIARYLKLCTLADDSFNAALDVALEEKRVKDSLITIRRLRPDEELDKCHVVFISHAERAHLPQLLPELKHHPILTITDSPGWAEKGIMIEMVVEQQRVTFKTNVDPTARFQVKISSKLLRLAKTAY